MAVDKHASFEEMIAYKKNKNSWPYPAVIERHYRGNIWCDVDPLIQAHRCQQLELKGDTLFYTFKVIENPKIEDFAFKSVTRSLVVEELR